MKRTVRRGIIVWVGERPKDVIYQKPRPSSLIADPDDPRHGTEKGYKAHRRANVPACEACFAAVSQVTSTRQKAKRRDAVHPTGTES